MSRSELASQALHIVLQHVMLQEEFRKWYPEAEEKNILALKAQITTHQLKIFRQDASNKEERKDSPEEDLKHDPLHPTCDDNDEIEKNSSKYILDMITSFDKQQHQANDETKVDDEPPQNNRYGRKVIYIWLTDFNIFSTNFIVFVLSTSKNRKKPFTQSATLHFANYNNIGSSAPLMHCEKNM
jgi:hypothetical protein